MTLGQKYSQQNYCCRMQVQRIKMLSSFRSQIARTYKAPHYYCMLLQRIYMSFIAADIRQSL